MPNIKKLIVFKGEDYIKDVIKALNNTLEYLAKEIHSLVLSDLAKIPFKNNRVKILDGMWAGKVTKKGVTETKIKNFTHFTSDAKRKSAVAHNVSVNVVKSGGKSVLSQGKLNKILMKYTGANWRDAYIGVLYEHGVGSEWDGQYSRMPNVSWASGSAKRSGAVVSRSKFIDYQGLGKGVWVDSGGNLRITGSKRAGQADAGFRNYIGEDTPAYHWFGGATKRHRHSIRNELLLTIKKVNIFSKKYWKIHGKFILGRD